MEEGMKIHVRIIGHSYIRRLGEFVADNEHYANLQLDKSQYLVDFQARGGLTFQRLAQCAEFTNFPKPPPAVCFLQMGGNDLCRRQPDKVFTDILSYAQFLRDGVGLKKVIVGQLLRRQPWATRQGYNEDVVSVNSKLRKETATLKNIYFWQHRGFWTDLSYLGRDGVHI
ncbi:uncharacterized protein LOC133195356 [Saccostrea echinata]|uniref:uncharacterized protein LOC133195356 n=1 Tax=Saccostrea echinata TaxID=191078 RepID=UPI002A83C79F|nr:uncharacterized protein LOC133195356 [Saccostrea echinata]